jgi:hypothetical protein
VEDGEVLVEIQTEEEVSRCWHLDEDEVRKIVLNLLPKIAIIPGRCSL